MHTRGPTSDLLQCSALAFTFMLQAFAFAFRLTCLRSEPGVQMCTDSSRLGAAGNHAVPCRCCAALCK